MGCGGVCNVSPYSFMPCDEIHSSLLWVNHGKGEGGRAKACMAMKGENPYLGQLHIPALLGVGLDGPHVPFQLYDSVTCQKMSTVVLRHTHWCE